MKAVKIIGGILLLLVLVVAVLSFIAPTHVHVERSATIDAPKDYVMAHVSSFDQMNKWSPWTKMDPEMTSNLEGEDGTVGALYSWEGNDQVGTGEQTITEINADRVVTHLHFIKPFEGEADATITVVENESGQSEVTWSYDSDMPRPMNIMNLFMDLDNMIGPDYEKGMNNLSEMVSTNKANRTEFDGFNIQKSELSPRTYVGVRDTLAMTELEPFFAANFGKLYGDCAKAKVAMAGKPSALFFTWDEANNQTECMAAMPITGESNLKQYETFQIAGPVLMIENHGPYEESGKAHMAMEKYMAWHNLDMNGPAIEEYVTDPTTVSDPSEIVTMIYYPI